MSVEEFTLKDDPNGLGFVYLHKWVDAMDSYNKWYEAQIFDIDFASCEDNQKVATRVKVHYKGWKKKFDEWISLQTADVDRIRPLHTFTECPPRLMSDDDRIEWLKVGTLLDALDSADKWYEAKVVESNDYLVKVHYSGWADAYDEWIDRQSYRIAQLNRGREAGKKAAQQKAVPQQKAQRKTNNRNEMYSDVTANARNEITVATVDGGESVNEKAEAYRQHYLSNFKPAANDEMRFRSVMQVKGWEIVDMGDDGNCLFRSVSHQIYGTEKYHLFIRQKCVEYIRAEAIYFSTFTDRDFNEYCLRMERSSVWGDNIEIQALSEIYRRNVEIYAYSDAPMKTFNNDKNNKTDPIRLSYHFNSHYNSVIDRNTHSHRIRGAECVGIEEKKAIDYSRLRSTAALDQSKKISDIDATELQCITAALEASRHEFQSKNNLDVSQFEAAIEASIKQLNDESLKKGIELSLPRVDRDRESEEMKQAILHSISDAPLHMIQTESDVLSKPIRAAINAGFTVEEATEAYSIFAANCTDESIVISRMIDYLRQKQMSLF